MLWLKHSGSTIFPHWNHFICVVNYLACAGMYRRENARHRLLFTVGYVARLDNRTSEQWVLERTVEYIRGTSTSRVAIRSVFLGDVPYLGFNVPRPGLGLPGTPNVPFFGREQIVLKCCSKRMQDRNVLASKLKLATRCHILKLKCIKFDFDWGFAPEPVGELTALPSLPTWI